MATYEDYGSEGIFLTAKRIRAGKSGKIPVLRKSKLTKTKMSKVKKTAKAEPVKKTRAKSVLSYFNQETSVTPAPKRRKSVTFSPDVQIETTIEMDRRIGPGFYRGLPRKCSEAQREIYSILERLTSGGILPLNAENDEDPVKVNNPEVGWDRDESPLELLQYWKIYPEEARGFIETLHRAVQERAPESRFAISYTFIPEYEKQVYRRVYISLKSSGTGFNVRRKQPQPLLLNAIHYQQMQHNSRSTPIVNLPEKRKMTPLNTIDERALATSNVPASLAMAFEDWTI